MAHFLLVYDRHAGHLLRQEQYDARPDALSARFEAEREFVGQPEIEIVALAAESAEDLLKTHGRYFLGLEELAARIH